MVAHPRLDDKPEDEEMSETPVHVATKLLEHVDTHQGIQSLPPPGYAIDTTVVAPRLALPDTPRAAGVAAASAVVRLAATASSRMEVDVTKAGLGCYITGSLVSRRLEIAAQRRQKQSAGRSEGRGQR